MTAYYNEFDPNAAAWLRELITMGMIAPGEVDERSIIEVQPADLAGFTQHHFFAGIGVWSYALRRAGWDDSTPVCTASLPCQPFSAAGTRKGKADERHLLPHFLELVKKCGFPTMFGEQVAPAIKQGWLDDLHDEMERENYTVGAHVLTAAGADSPHIRQRIYWTASRLENATGAQRESGAEVGSVFHGVCGNGEISNNTDRSSAAQSGGLGNADNARSQEHRGSGNVHIRQPDGENSQRSDIDASVFGGVADTEPRRRGESVQQVSGESPERGRGDSVAGGLGDTEHDGHIASEIRRSTGEGETKGGVFKPERSSSDFGLGNATGGGNSNGKSGRLGSEKPAEHRKTWQGNGEANRTASGHDLLWWPCRDGKARPIKSGIAPLVDGFARGVVHSVDHSISPNETAEARVMRLKGYGNAIQADVATLFISAVMEVMK